MELPALAADAGIHCLPIPTPFAVGRVNCYVIEDEPLTLIDTGPNSARAFDELEQGLNALGHRVEDLELIVLTHQHMDHLGLAGILARRSGAEVATLDVLAPWVSGFGRNMAADDEFSEAIMTRHGIPTDVSYALRAVSAVMRAWGAKVEVTRTLTDGGTLDLRDRSLRVVHRPGHSPSDTVFLDEERKLAIGGDHLLKHISSNPLIARPLNGEVADRPQSLVIYLDSMRRTREMELDLVLSGHGDPITEHRELIDERIRMHERRAEKMHRMIAEQPQTAYELAHAMWGKIAVTQAYLTLSEVLGHTDLLLNAGRVHEVVGDDGVARFEAA